LVEPDGDDGGYVLRDGERRLRAAREAGVKQVPVLVRDLNGSAITAALVTAIQQEGLSPIEEARTIERVMAEEGVRRQKDVAQRIGKKPEFVRERLRLLRLPEDVQQHIHDGTVPLSVVAVLEKITKVSPDVASACAQHVAERTYKATTLENAPWEVVHGASKAGDEPPVAVACGYYHRLDAIPLPDDTGDDLREWIAAESLREHRDRIVITDEVIDAARAYGCLLEFQHDRYFSHAFICDRAFLADQLRQERERREKADAKAAKVAAKLAENDAGAAKSEQQVKEQRREQHQERERIKVEARGANLDFGAVLGEQFDRLAPDLDELRPLVYLALRNDAGEIAARLCLCRLDWQEVEVKRVKSTGRSKEKVTYLPKHEAEERLFAWLADAETPERLLGRFYQALAAAAFADERCEPMSRQVRWSLPGKYADKGDPDRVIHDKVTKLVKRHLPKPLAAKARSPY
jgi:ParB/RepB/Spo0J family partition protein